MISIDIQITYPECLNVTAAAMEKAGAGGIMNSLVAHFDQRGAEPNKRGWPSQGVWGKIADSTGVNLQDDGAAVTISDIVFWRKYAPDGRSRPSAAASWPSPPPRPPTPPGRPPAAAPFRNSTWVRPSIRMPTAESGCAA